MEYKIRQVVSFEKGKKILGKVKLTPKEAKQLDTKGGFTKSQVRAVRARIKSGIGLVSAKVGNKWVTNPIYRK